MREIKCRGYNEEYDKWIIGSYVDGYIVNEVMESNEEYIVIGKWAPVDVESVGQCTGLKDKNGVEIYEGDVVKSGNGYGLSDEVVTIVWRGTGLYPVNRAKRQKTWKAVVKGEIIGNIYENKELMEG